MKVKELIEELKKHDPEIEVVTLYVGSFNSESEILSIEEKQGHVSRYVVIG